MGLGEVFETIGESIGNATEVIADAAKDVDWATVGKIAGGVAGVAAVGGTAYYVGTQVGHTDGMKDGYKRASGEYADKFERQERKFRDASAKMDEKINTILKNLKA